MFTPFPLSEQLLCGFAAHLATQGLAPQTGKAYLSALRSTQISLGLPDPREHSSLPMLKRVQAGISQARLLSGPAKRVRLPITGHLMGRLQESHARSSNPEKVVLWAIACSAFFGFSRLGELLPASVGAFNPATCLAWGDVAVNNVARPTMVKFHLKQSKCDQLSSGSDVVVGATGARLCPVTAVVCFMEQRGDRPGPFFLDSAFKPISKPWFIDRLRELLIDSRGATPPICWAQLPHWSCHNSSNGGH